MTPDEMRANRRRHMDKMGRKRRQLAQLQGQSTSLIPAAPIRLTLNRMHDLGWSYEALAAMIGTGTAAGLNLIAGGSSLRCERRFEPIAHMPTTLAVPPTVGDTMWVPTLGATRRVRALLAAGWRHDDITEAMGRSSASLAGGTYLRMRAIDWRIADAAYERMSASTGASVRTAQRAIARGYVPPHAWRDIDNPDETPSNWQWRARKHITDSAGAAEYDETVVERILTGDWHMASTPAEKTEVVARWVATGRSLNELERHTGWRAARYTNRGDAA